MLLRVEDYKINTTDNVVFMPISLFELFELQGEEPISPPA